MEKEYKKGDVVWLAENNFVVKCVITEVDDHFRKQHPDAHIFYWVDEPIGHGMTADEFFDTFEEAAEVCVENHENEQDSIKRYNLNPECIKDTLDKFRNGAGRFILSTHLDGDNYGKKELITDEQVKEFVKGYPPKEEGKDWIKLENFESYRRQPCKS